VDSEADKDREAEAIVLNLKRPYTITLNEDVARQVEAYKETTGKSYNKMFLEAILMYLEDKKDDGN
jgi:hypothetical protein